MFKLKHSKVLTLIFLVLLLGYPINGYSLLFYSDNESSTEQLGSYTGVLTYTWYSPTSARLDISIRNTTAGASQAFITGIAFNNPGGITGVGPYSLPGGSWSLLGGPSFNDGISTSPFGDFDIGAALGGDWLGGGSPNQGIPIGVTGSFNFFFTGSGLNLLTEESFVAALSGGNEFFVARFRGIEPGGGSDKVPAYSSVPPPASVPEPGTMLLLGLGLLGLGIATRRKS